MATKKGVWNLQQVRDKQLQSLWDYSGESAFFTWGNNQHGTLGLNDTTQRSSPTQVPGTTWSSFSRSNGHDVHQMVASKTDGTLWSWGYNGAGSLGLNQGPGVRFSSPVQIGSLTDWGAGAQISAGGPYMTTVIKTNGEMWAWGNNHNGMLGQNNKTDYSSPVQVPGTTWSVVRSSTYSAAALKTDGTLWAWGNGDWGALGQNSRTWYSSPVQIGSDTTWQHLSGGKGLFAAIKTDGTIWSWGYGSQGQLGLNVGAAAGWRSSPCQIPGLWESPIGHQRFGMAARKIL